MKLILATFMLFIIGPSFAKGNLLLVGKVPAEYLGIDSNKSVEACLGIKDGVISHLEKLSTCDLKKIEKELSTKNVELKTDGKFNIMYPGLIDLHNHTKQNVLSVWGAALGQFANRFEWRGWSNYKKSVSKNMNPWIGFGKEMNCAAFRWSELQAMVIGTTFLQGPSSCISKFSIHQVEDKKAYKTNKAKVQAPTDIVIPADMVFAWNTVRPRMLKLKTDYAGALKSIIHEYCPALKKSIKDVLGKEELQVLKNQAALKAGCGIKSKDDEKKFPPKFVRYIYFVHKTIAGRLNYLANPNRSAVIGHLAEGRRKDPYNMLEFQMIKLFGLDQPFVNFVHALGLTAEDFGHMAKKSMGLIWSPFSNLLLYAQTADIALAKSKGVRISLGSDWTPTGSRGVLEELKLAYKYVAKDPEGKKLKSIFSDKDLYKMVTENPARMINHWENSEEEAGIGRLVVGSMGTLIVAEEQDTNNVYSNLVRKTHAENLNLIVIDGVPLYGNKSLIEKAAGPVKFEVISNQHFAKAEIPFAEVPQIESERPTKGEKRTHLITLSKFSKKLNLIGNKKCDFNEAKVLVHQNSNDKTILAFNKETGLNLDRYSDIAKLLGLSLLTQSRNALGSDTLKAFVPNYFPPLYSCEDTPYQTGQVVKGKTHKVNGLYTFVKENSDDDDFTRNQKNYMKNREKKFCNKPKKMAESYGKTYDCTKQY